MTSGNIVKLNVGGTVFETTRSTLSKYDGMIRKMLESRVPVEKDSAGCIFIDRDSTHFRLILNFLRDGTIELPKDQKEVKEILKEAAFFGLHELVKLCTDYSTNSKDLLQFQGNESQVFEALLRSKKVVVVYKYPPFSLSEEDTGRAAIRAIIQKYENVCKFIMIESDKKVSEWTSYHYTLDYKNTYRNNNESVKIFFKKEEQRLAKLFQPRQTK